MGIRLLVEGSTIKKPMAVGHRRTAVRSSLPHLLTQQGSGEGKDSGSPTHRSASRKDAGARSLGHTERPDSTATTLVPGKGKKGKAKSASALVCLPLQDWEPPNTRAGHTFNRSLCLKQPEAWGNTMFPKYPRSPKAISARSLQALPVHLGLPSCQKTPVIESTNTAHQISLNIQPNKYSKVVTLPGS